MINWFFLYPSPDNNTYEEASRRMMRGKSMNRLHPRIQVLWLLRVLFASGVIGGIAAGVTWYFSRPIWLALVVFGGMIVIGVVLARARYRRWGYEIREDSLYLERGVFTEVRTIVPLVRIQHVDSRRNPIERLTGLARTVVYTAGSRGADVQIPGLTVTGAEELQERLKHLAIQAEGADAV